MDSKKTHKLSKASVAAVLAASGVIVAMPQPTHAYAFGDLNPNADYYEPVMDLYKRNIATGDSKGNFRPNEAITRADAARMIALSIDINTKNPKNPRFTDVQATHPSYKYIAALAEAGIIGGFPDDSFKPNEYITRGQMAKIMSLGYRFGVSTKLTTTFQDVPATNANAYFIQTLVDLNITKGITPIAFEPSSTVTRGQMATFIWRAEKADKGTPVYTVGDITGDKVYINGVPYTIASSLSSIFNAANKRILQGAHIEGTFTSNTLTAVSKLTLNASGTSTSLLALDGDYSTFGGELIINGSYLRLKNIDLTGRVEVAETPRKSLAKYMTNPLQNARIASINGFGFIDWGKPTEPDEESFLNPDDNENLTEKPDPTKPPHKSPYNTRMPKIEKYVDFSNSTVTNLFITQNRSFVSAEGTIDRITVQRDVAQYELYADANAMYIDTDVNVTVFGVNDIKYVYKNTLKNVFFHTDSYYDYLYVTTGSGFIDIGEHVYIGDAIIPPNKSVNDIFDDYENDDGNIGWIEDENGNPVERDPDKDLVVPDVTGPKILNLAVTAGGTLANVTLTADEDGMYYYMVKKTDEKPPSINEIKTGGGKYSGNGPIKQDTPVNFTVNDLETLTDYTIYVVVIDGSDNVSNKESKDFTTIDGQPPTLKLKKGDPMYGGKRVQFVITPTEAGTYYYYIRPKTSAAGPTVDDIIKTHTGTGKATEPGDIIVTEKYYGAKPSLEEIQPNTTYEIFAVMVDASGNKMRTVSDIEIKTEGLDSEHPYVDNPVLELIDKEKGIFELTVFEELDKESAENIDNYILSGTGIMNITGDKETKPSAVTYSGKKIRLTIPSITALVNGDTIRVTVLPGVKDLAENPFENIDTVPVEQVPRNYAEYKHGDSMIPVIKITDVIPGPDKYEVEVETKKAGTYYYMILPDSFNFTKKDITNRDFVDEFSSDKVIVKDKFVTKDKDGNPVIGNDGKPKTDYLSKGENPAVLGKFKFDVQKPSNIDPFTSYSLYVVLKDRSGQLSIMDSRQLISDSKPPLVSGITAKPVPKTDDKDVKIEFNVDEKGTAFFIPVKKYIMKDGIRTLNAEYFNPDGTMKDVPGTHEANLSDAERRAKFEKIGAVESKGMDGSGSFNHTLKGLDAHEEYGIYIGVEDTFKNFTVRQRSTPTAIGDLEPSGDPMKVTVYTDGTKPYIKTDRSNIYSKLHTEALIYRTPDPSDPKFEITFNEAILRQADLTNYNTSLISINDALNLSSIMVIKDASNKDITAEFVYDSYVVGTSTTADSKLVIKPIDEANANKSITISLKEDITNAYDYQKLNTFDIDKIGKYVYPKTFVNIMSDAKLGPRTDDPSNSKKITITPQLSATSVKEIYYVVVNTGTVDVPTEVQILDLVRYNKQPTNMMINLYGKRLIEKPGDTSNEMTLEANGTGSNVFRKGQRVYMITLDEYGNVAWVVNETNDKQKYSTVVE